MALPMVDEAVRSRHFLLAPLLFFACVVSKFITPPGTGARAVEPVGLVRGGLSWNVWLIITGS